MVTSHETIDTFNAVVDIAIGTCLFTIAPNFNIVTVVCQSNFATDRSWRFFSATIIGTERSEDVVKSYDPGIKAKVLRVVTTDALHVELFPAVAVFRVSWISIFFSQRRGVGFFLFVAGVNTGARGVKITLYAILPRRLNCMHIDERVVANNYGFVSFNETNATHVGGQPVNFIDVFGSLDTVACFGQV